MKAYEILNELIKISTISNQPITAENVINLRANDLKEKVGDFIVLRGFDTSRNFNQLIENAYKIIPEIAEKISIYSFRKSLFSEIFKFHIAKTVFTRQDWQHFTSNILNVPEVRVEIMVPMVGINLKKPFLTVGDFTIHKRENLIINYPDCKDQIDAFMRSEYYLSISLTTIDIIHARIKASELFDTFKDVFNFVLNVLHGLWAVSLTHEASPEAPFQFIFQNAELIDHRNFKSKYAPVIDAQLQEFTNNFKIVLIDLITKKNKTAFEKNLLNAAVWFGKAVGEKEPTRALVQYVLAWESLFVEKQEFISEGIVAQLCDNIAFLIFDNVDERIDMTKKLRKIYDSRSKIIHEGLSMINSSQVQDCSLISNQIMAKVLSNEFLGCSSKNDFVQILIRRKYQ